MTKQDKDEAKRLLALLVDGAEHEQTPEEAEKELITDGVNVTGFLARVHQAVKQKEERLAWGNDARRKRCLFCKGYGNVHVPPCYWDPFKPYDGIMHNPPPPCRCAGPICSDCAGSGERVTLPEEGFELATTIQTFWPFPGEPFIGKILLDGNYWSTRILPLYAVEVESNTPFEAMLVVPWPNLQPLLTSGMTIDLFMSTAHFCRAGRIKIL
jgi:hypothetical protein